MQKQAQVKKEPCQVLDDVDVEGCVDDFENWLLQRLHY